jgi:hypothetical protein
VDHADAQDITDSKCGESMASIFLIKPGNSVWLTMQSDSAAWFERQIRGIEYCLKFAGKDRQPHCLNRCLRN